MRNQTFISIDKIMDRIVEINQGSRDALADKRLVYARNAAIHGWALHQLIVWHGNLSTDEAIRLYKLRVECADLWKACEPAEPGG